LQVDGACADMAGRNFSLGVKNVESKTYVVRFASGAPTGLGARTSTSTGLGAAATKDADSASKMAADWKSILKFFELVELIL